MDWLDRRTDLAQSSRDVHEAAWLAYHNVLGAARLNVPHFGFHHRAGDFGVDDTKDSAKAAARLFVRKRNELQTAYGLKQPLWLFAHIEDA